MKKITVYTANPCPYCRNAKTLLRNRGLAFEEIVIAWDDQTIWRDLEKRTGMKTVPQIFFDDQCIGGYTELAALAASGKLDESLA